MSGLVWVALLAASVAARTASVWASGRIGAGIGARARRRLIESILGLDPDTICHRGVGQFLGVVAETTVIETATVEGALAAATLAFAAGGVAVVALAVTIDTEATTALLGAFGGCLLVAQGSTLIGRGVLDLADAHLAARAVAEITELAPVTATPAAEPAAGRGEHPVTAAKLGYTYPGSETPAVEDVDLTVRAGDRVLLTGASGSGKTTLAHVLAGLRPPTAGTLRRRGTTALVPQDDDNHVLLGTRRTTCSSMSPGLPKRTTWTPPKPSAPSSASGR